MVMTVEKLSYIYDLQQKAYNVSQIGEITCTDPSTVRRYLKKIVDFDLVIENPMTEEQAELIRTTILSNAHPSRDGYLIPDWKEIRKELARVGVTLLSLHEAYERDAAYIGKNAYSYSYFAKSYRSFCKAKRLVMRIVHKPGDVVEYDWSGKVMSYMDPATGKTVEMHLFVAVLPYSLYFYVNAYTNMELPTWIDAVCSSYEYFGGVPNIMRPDNLKTAVIKHTRNEVVLQKDFRELSDHYDSAIIPTGVRKPTHKSHAESTVKKVTNEIIGKLRDCQFFSAEEVQKAVREEGERLNNKWSKAIYSTPRDLFENEEKAFLKPLPPTRYVLTKWTCGTVGNDYMVKYEVNSYSVPYVYVGKQYAARARDGLVEIYVDCVLIASHPYFKEHQRNVIVKEEHRPKHHQAVMNYTPEKLREYATEVGPATVMAMEYNLGKEKIEEQGVQFCVSIKSLGETHGKAKLEEACNTLIARNEKLEVAAIRAEISKMKKATQEEMAHVATGYTRGAEQYDM